MRNRYYETDSNPREADPQPRGHHHHHRFFQAFRREDSRGSCFPGSFGQGHERGFSPRRGFGPGGPDGPEGFGPGGPPFAFGRHGWRGGRGGHRPFDHGELRFVILALLAETPRHGYEIIKAIEDKFAGSYSPSPGVVYPTLTMLEETGNATVEEAGGKKRYTITDAGRAELAANQPAVDAAMGRMAAISGEQGGRGLAPQIIRAMENLRLSMRLRIRRGAMTEEQLLTIVSALDNAAQQIERS